MVLLSTFRARAGSYTARKGLDPRELALATLLLVSSAMKAKAATPRVYEEFDQDDTRLDASALFGSVHTGRAPHDDGATVLMPSAFSPGRVPAASGTVPTLRPAAGTRAPSSGAIVRGVPLAAGPPPAPTSYDVGTPAPSARSMPAVVAASSGSYPRSREEPRESAPIEWRPTIIEGAVAVVGGVVAAVLIIVVCVYFL
jgi:hypothetical protein